MFIVQRETYPICLAVARAIQETSKEKIRPVMDLDTHESRTQLQNFKYRKDLRRYNYS